MKNNTASKIEKFQIPSKPQKRTISGTQFKAIQLAVKAAVGDAAPESTRQAITSATVYGMTQGTRSELLLEVEAERMIDARHVELKLHDAAGRRFIWIGTTGDAARLKPGQHVLLKGTAEKVDRNGTHLKHCRVIEVA